MINIFKKSKASKKPEKGIQFINGLFKKRIISYPIDFEIYQPSGKEFTETLNCWFGSPKWSEKGDKFIQFGMEGTGSMFCLWYYPNLISEPPIVLFGSEGERYLVAENINGFINQLASGKLFSGGYWLEPEAEEKINLNWKILKRKAKKYLGVWEESPEILKDRAKDTHPDFNAWVERNTN